MNKNSIEFVQNNRIVRIDFAESGIRPSTTVLNYVRQNPETRGTKEGCAEGDCGACTVVIGELDSNGNLVYKAVDSCVMFLPSLHGRQLITVEDLAQKSHNPDNLHPVQKSMVEEHGSQCGFCTPGFVMSQFAMFKNEVTPDRKTIVESLAGNLCRCTGYESIFRATEKTLLNITSDHFSKNESHVKALLGEIQRRTKTIEIATKTQQYWLPMSLKEALTLRSKHPDAVIVSGSTDIAVRQNKMFVYADEIIDISNIEEIKSISANHEFIVIGAGTILEDVKKYAEMHIKALSEVLSHFASLQIRNMASIGGNLCNASPVGDLIPMMFALKANAVIQSIEGKRVVSFEEFIVGYRKSCLQSNELLVEIQIPNIPSNANVSFRKISTREHVDISTISLATRIEYDSNNRIKEIILAFGGMAAEPKRATKVEQLMIGKLMNNTSVEEAAGHVFEDFTPISDARSTAEYRINVAKNLIVNALLKK
ncbi:MAG: xanthine dehydrogenase small subunit [Salinivirgaceae bacterium]|nr:xanthine dehydrogenase small subunit [Salinivirgaceae bacterium]